MALKTCEKCGVQQDTNDYYKKETTLDGLDPWCKKCVRRKFKILNLNGRSQRKSHLKRNYKLTLKEYDQLFHKQCGYCYICLTHQDKLKKKLAVDHCHQTGKVRGLLCMKCNTALGKFNDDIYLIERALAYLKKSQEKNK